MIDFYTLSPPISIIVFIKRMGRNTLPQTCNEVVKVEKEILNLKENPRMEGMDDHISSTEKNNYLKHNSKYMNK